MGAPGRARRWRPPWADDQRPRPAQGPRAREPRAEAGERDSSQGVRVFRAGGARPPTEVMVTFIDDHRSEYGVEPICEVLPIAPSTYYAHRAREENPELQPARAKRDEQLRPEIQRVWTENLEVYGADKVWKQLLREGHEVARCTGERVM